MQPVWMTSVLSKMGGEIVCHYPVLLLEHLHSPFELTLHILRNP